MCKNLQKMFQLHDIYINLNNHLNLMEHGLLLGKISHLAIPYIPFPYSIHSENSHHFIMNGLHLVPPPVSFIVLDCALVTTPIPILMLLLVLILISVPQLAKFIFILRLDFNPVQLLEFQLLEFHLSVTKASLNADIQLIFQS